MQGMVAQGYSAATAPATAPAATAATAPLLLLLLLPSPLLLLQLVLLLPLPALRLARFRIGLPAGRYSLWHVLVMPVPLRRVHGGLWRVQATTQIQWAYAGRPCDTVPGHACNACRPKWPAGDH